MNQHEKLNYVEFPSKDLIATKHFFSEVFGWVFTDCGPEYCAFANQGIDGGFFYSQNCNQTKTGGALLVFYSNDIKSSFNKIVKHGGEIVQPIFDFPGGCRFHFLEPSGNEFAVWSESSHD